MPVWVKEKPKERANQKIEVEAARIVESRIQQAKYSATIKADGEVHVKVNTIYFPGWQAKVDGQKTLINYQNSFGLITFKLPKGEHKVIIDYGKTPVHLFSEIISLVALIGTGSYLYILWRKQNS